MVKATWVVLFALTGSASALFDRTPGICNRNPGGGSVKCDCLTPVGEGNCVDALRKTYNRCSKVDNSFTLQKCQERAESIPSRKIRGISFANFKDSRSCQIHFDAAVDLTTLCPTDFGGFTGFAGTGRVDSVESVQDVTCCRCE